MLNSRVPFKGVSLVNLPENMIINCHHVEKNRLLVEVCIYTCIYKKHAILIVYI